MLKIYDVKAFAKIKFTFAVFTVILTQWILLEFPEQFYKFYASVYAVLMVKRFALYCKNGCVFWFLELCYYANISILLAATTSF